MRSAMQTIFSVLTALLVCLPVMRCDVTMLNSNNLRDTLSQSEIILVNFYADWCRFSQMLAPIFADAEQYVSNHIDSSHSRVSFAKVDCEAQPEIAREFGVNKYPTIKLFRYGEVSKKEYRGQRSVEALAAYVQEQLSDVVKVHPSISEFNQAPLDISANSRILIAYLKADSVGLQTVRKVASKYRTTPCQYHVVYQSEERGDAHRLQESLAMQVQFGDEEWIGAINSESSAMDRFVGQLDDVERLSMFVLNKCESLVRELTFENAEELTEEGLPFLLLFYHPDHDANDLRRRYKAAVEKEVAHERYNMNFLSADGVRFEHPLHHMGRSAADLPLIAIDSFKHIYLFPHDVREYLENPNGQLKQFVDDHNSGKLHQELHEREQQQFLNGMNSQVFAININGQQVLIQQPGAGSHGHPHAHQQIEAQPEQPSHGDDEEGDDNDEEHGDGDGDGDGNADVDESGNVVQNKQVFESVFKKLGPSKQRYSIIKEEL